MTQDATTVLVTHRDASRPTRTPNLSVPQLCTNGATMRFSATLLRLKSLILVQIFNSVLSLPQINQVSNGLIDCRVPTVSYFPDPDDCRHFYHCSDWSGLQKKSCGPSLYFNSQTGVCDWPSVVQRIRPECPDLATLNTHIIPQGFQRVNDHQSVINSPVAFPQHDPNLAPQVRFIQFKKLFDCF